MKSRRAVLLVLLVAVAILGVILHLKDSNAEIHLKDRNAESRLMLQTAQSDGFTVRTFKFKEDDGRLRRLAAVYWKADGSRTAPLTQQDIKKVLDSNADGKEWKLVSEDNKYTRWQRSDGISEATYRMEDFKLCLFSKDFVEWKKRKDFSKRDAEIFMEIVK